jgi:hypothetical protein
MWRKATGCVLVATGKPLICHAGLFELEFSENGVQEQLSLMRSDTSRDFRVDFQSAEDSAILPIGEWHHGGFWHSAGCFWFAATSLVPASYVEDLQVLVSS